MINHREHRGKIRKILEFEFSNLSVSVSQWFKICNAGFTLLEVMISLAIVGALLVTLIYTLNYHLGIADRHGVTTVSMNLAKEKMYEMERSPSVGKGSFPGPYSAFSYETAVKDSSFPGFSEMSVVVRNGRETLTLSELIRKKST